MSLEQTGTDQEVPDHKNTQIILKLILFYIFL